MPSSLDRKRACAVAALEHVASGMSLGLGSGSTACLFIDAVGEKIRAGLDVRCVATSVASERRARARGIPLISLDEALRIDMTVDGADEIDPALNLIKGGGGALLREKIVASASARMIVIADETKRVEWLGRRPLPVEVARFGAEATLKHIEQAAGNIGLSSLVTLRMVGDEPFISDGDNLICDCGFRKIPDPRTLAAALNAIPGVVEHGLFLGMASLALIATADGVEEMTPY